MRRKRRDTLFRELGGGIREVFIFVCVPEREREREGGGERGADCIGAARRAV